MYSKIAARSVLRKAVFQTRPVGALNVRHSSTMHDNDPELLELEKKRNMAGIQHRTSTPHKHAPGWNEHLASASEASLKADKADGSPIDLQGTTVEYIQARHSPDEAADLLDQVNGPLSSAKTDDTSTGPQVLVRKTVRETTEVWKNEKSTASEDVVKAERGVLSTE
ncbi:hypothetical protein MIND_00251600 [Mycena indigotica]|uniref:Uncharacterized protein n=1 Tax=Mycena indigotica TaxID=2126181 RepID=A0A8H6T7A7_9AGAR|nr:uncharacterized protein MIND_00251600 [Mycena indigotica]KAF7312383.1 hypothetical protein MIND_00251600 [Mycena indigotica]